MAVATVGVDVNTNGRVDTNGCYKAERGWEWALMHFTDQIVAKDSAVVKHKPR